MTKKKNNNLWYIIGGIVIVVLVLWIILANTGGSKVICNHPYIQVGQSCCLDDNANNICDSDETIQQNTNINNQEENVNTIIVPSSEIDKEKAEELAKDYILTYSRFGNMGISYEGVTLDGNDYFIKIKNGDWCSVIKVNKIERTVSAEIDGTCLLCSNYEFWDGDPWEGDVPTTTSECKNIIFENFAETLEANGENCEIMQIDIEGDKTICKCCSNLFDEWERG